MPVENLESFPKRVKRARILNFGPPLTGKTESLITLMKLLRKLYPDRKPILRLYDLDGNAEPLVRAALKAGFSGDDLEIYTYAPKGGDKIGEGAGRPRAQGRDIWLQFTKDFNTLYDLVGPDGNWLEGRKAPLACCIDSVTKLQDIILDFVLCSVGHELGAKGTDARADFGQQMQKTTEVIDSCKGLPCVWVFNAHERLNKNETTGELRIDPLFTGESYAANISREFTAVLYSTTKSDGKGGVEYIWKVRPSGFVKGPGTRTSDDMPAEIPQNYELLL